MELPAFMSQQQAEDALHVYLRLGGISEHNIEQACHELSICKEENWKQQQLVALLKSIKCKTLNTSTTVDDFYVHDALIPPEEWLLLVSELMKDKGIEPKVRATNAESTVLHLSESSSSSSSSLEQEEWKHQEEEEEELSPLLVETHTPSKLNETAKRELKQEDSKMPSSSQLIPSNTFNSSNVNWSNNNNYNSQSIDNNNSKNCNSMSSLVSCVNNKYITENPENTSVLETINNCNLRSNYYNKKKMNSQMLNLFIACGARQIFVPRLRQREWRLTHVQWKRRVEELCLLLNCKLPPEPIVDQVASVISEDEDNKNIKRSNNNSVSMDKEEHYITLQRFTAAISAELATCASCVNIIDSQHQNCYTKEQIADKHKQKKRKEYHESMVQENECNVESILVCMRKSTLPCWLCVLSCIAERELEEFTGAPIARFVRSFLCVQCVLVVLLEQEHEHVHALRKSVHMQHQREVMQSKAKDLKHAKNNKQASKRKLNGEQPVNGHNALVLRNGESCQSVTPSTRPFLWEYEEEEEQQNLDHDNNENVKMQPTKPRYMESKPLDELSKSIVARTRARRLLETLRKSAIPINRLEGFAQLEADEPTDFAQNLLEEWQNSAKADKQRKSNKMKHSKHKEMNNHKSNKENNKSNRCSSLETQLEPSVRNGKSYKTSRSPNPSYIRPATINKHGEKECNISSNSSSSCSFSSYSEHSESESSSSYDSDAMLPAQMLFSRPPLHNNTCRELKSRKYNNTNNNAEQQYYHQQHHAKGVNGKLYKSMPQSLLCPRRAVPAGVMFKVNASLPASHQKNNSSKTQIFSATGARSNTIYNSKSKMNNIFERLSRPTVDVRWFQSSRANSYNDYNNNTNNYQYNEFDEAAVENDNNRYSFFNANIPHGKDRLASTTKQTPTSLSRVNRAVSTPQLHAQRPQSAMAYVAASSQRNPRTVSPNPAQQTAAAATAKELSHETLAISPSPESEEEEYQQEKSKREITSACLPKSSSNNKSLKQHSKEWNNNVDTNHNVANDIATSYSTRHSSAPHKKPVVEQYLEKVEAELRQENLLHVQSLLQELRSDPRERLSSMTYNSKNSVCNISNNNSVNNKEENKVHIGKTPKSVKPAKSNNVKLHKNGKTKKIKQDESNLNTTESKAVPGKESYSTRSRNLIKSISQIYGANENKS